MGEASTPERLPDEAIVGYLEMRDNEGNRCSATVYEVVDPVVAFEPDDSTWVSGESVQATGIAVVEPAFGC